MRKKVGILFVLVLLFSAGIVHALDFSLDGDVRSRYCYMIDKHGSFEVATNFDIWDVRGRLGAKLETSNGFFAYYKLELGNIAFGEPYMGGAQGSDVVNIETKNVFVGYDGDFLKGKVGLFDFNTPLGGEIDDDLAGINLKFTILKNIHIEAMYSRLYSGMSNTNMGIDMDNFVIPNAFSSHLYYLQAGYDLQVQSIGLSNKVDVYYMRLNDTRFFDARLNWFAVYDKLNFWIFELDGGVSFNFGQVIYDAGSVMPLNAMYAKAKIKVDVFGLVDVFARIHYATGNAEGETNAVRQFQTIGGRGDFDSDLGILFGGSPFSSQAYFDYRYIGLDTRRNLTQGKIQILKTYDAALGFYPQYDPGLFVIELGAQKKFDAIGLRTKFVFGMASTANPIYVIRDGATNAVSGLGYEFDFNNRLKLAKGTYLTLNAALLLHGNALRSIYAVNSENISSDGTITNRVLIGGEPTIKIDAEIQIEI